MNLPKLYCYSHLIAIFTIISFAFGLSYGGHVTKFSTPIGRSPFRLRIPAAHWSVVLPPRPIISADKMAQWLAEWSERSHGLCLNFVKFCPYFFSNMSNPTFRTRISQLRKKKITKKKIVRRGNPLNRRNNGELVPVWPFVFIVIELPLSHHKIYIIPSSMSQMNYRCRKWWEVHLKRRSGWL